MQQLREKIFSIGSEAEFNSVCLEVFKYQYSNNKVYSEYCTLLKVVPDAIVYWKEIPFLPISAFKSHTVLCGDEVPDLVFTSSGTTGQTPSRHFVKDPSLYEESFLKCFRIFYGDPAHYRFLFLLPSYLEREGSSLVYMARHFVELSRHNGSGFFLRNHDELINALNDNDTPTILFGVTYALLDLAEKGIKLSKNCIVFETGGMKGTRKELVKEELHQILIKKFGVEKIHSEYGMTELLSQAWSRGDGIFESPPWMRVVVRDAYDPFSLEGHGKRGAINVIDLANIHSCSFIATEDLGKTSSENSFEVIGRFSDAELRGCNLMI